MLTLQLQEGSDETTTEFVTAIEGAAGTLESGTIMPDIFVTNKNFNTPEYPADGLLSTWWKSGQPCMVVDEEMVILVICMGAFKGLSYGIQVSPNHPPTIIQISTDSLKQKN